MRRSIGLKIISKRGLRFSSFICCRYIHLGGKGWEVDFFFTFLSVVDWEFELRSSFFGAVLPGDSKLLCFLAGKFPEPYWSVAGYRLLMYVEMCQAW